MEHMTNNEEVVFKYVLDHPQYYKYIEKGFFNDKNLSALILVAKKFYDKYKEVPSENQMVALFKDNAKIEIESGFIRAVYAIDTETYDRNWLKNTTEAWIKWKVFNNKLVSGIEVAKMTDVNMDNVDETVQRIVDIIGESNEVNFNFDGGLDFFNADSHYQDSSKKISSGYKYIDSLTSGYDEKTLVTYIGQSNVGKCVCGDSLITVKNRKTGAVMTLEISDFFEMIKK